MKARIIILSLIVIAIITAVVFQVMELCGD